MILPQYQALRGMNKCKPYAARAVELDQMGNCEDAKEFYLQAAGILLEAAAKEKIPRYQQSARESAGNYIKERLTEGSECLHDGQMRRLLIQ